MPTTATVKDDAVREFLEWLPLTTIATVSVVAWTPTSQYIPWSQSALVMDETTLENGRLELTLQAGEKVCLPLEHVWFAYHDRRNNHLIVHLR
ncbi:MAG: hypothetical protein HY700_13485 [Gemmatimonadetes bacterium]|nr:hypothetical protein [Gemmatimonadota bacterium]